MKFLKLSLKELQNKKITYFTSAVNIGRFWIKKVASRTDMARRIEKVENFSKQLIVAVTNFSVISY